MKYISKELNNWAIDKIKKEFNEDIALLIGHQHWKIPIDGDEVAFNFFVPCTDRGYNLSQTFIIDDIGYDLFPMSWERLEGLANINESITTCLADGVILYARNEEYKQRFIRLQKLLQTNLRDNKFTYNKGLEKINIAMELFQNMLFEKSLSNIRKASGYIATYLSEAIACVNGTYFKRGPENQISYLKQVSEVPEGFIDLYYQIIKAVTIQQSRDLCYKMLAITRDFFSERQQNKQTKAKNHNFKDLADWYQEGTYWFRRIYYYSDTNNAENCFAWGCTTQCEFDYVTEEFGLKKMELMNVFDKNNLSLFRRRAEEIEDYIVSEIKKHNVKIQKFNTFDEFIGQRG